MKIKLTMCLLLTIWSENTNIIMIDFAPNVPEGIKSFTSSLFLLFSYSTKCV